MPQDPALRAQALALKINGFSYDEIEEQTGFSDRTVRSILKKAEARGFNPAVSKQILSKYVENGARPGRPRKRDAAQKDE